jgi:hypothetical protein
MGVSFREEGRSIYDAVRHAWIIDPARANGRIVLAHDRGLVLGVFIPNRWMKATRDNFPAMERSYENRWGFEGRDADQAISAHYLRKRVPDEYRKKGARGPIKYADPPFMMLDTQK